MPVAKRVPPPHIFHARFQDLERLADIPAGSVQLVLTDPPYGKDWLDQWGELSAFCSRILEPGGTLVTYTGKIYLDHVMNWLSTHLTYRWMISSYEQEIGSVYRACNVAGRWKPILIYSNGHWKPRTVEWTDVLESPMEKGLHPWQQPVTVAKGLVSQFSDKGDLVVDPCGGSFTVARACMELGRRCVSCDSDLSAVEIGRSRLKEK